MGRGAWQATVHGVTKSQTGLRDYITTISKLWAQTDQQWQYEILGWPEFVRVFHKMLQKNSNQLLDNPIDIIMSLLLYLMKWGHGEMIRQPTQTQAVSIGTAVWAHCDPKASALVWSGHCPSQEPWGSTPPGPCLEKAILCHLRSLWTLDEVEGTGQGFGSEVR